MFAFQRSLQLKKKAFDRTITELEKKAAEETVANEVIEKLSSLVHEREGIERKLSTTYSLGRDEVASSSKSKSLLPVYDAKTRSYSFQGAKKESVTIFHTLSDTSSESSSDRDSSGISEEDKDQSTAKAKAKGKAKVKAKAKAPTEAESSSDGGIIKKDYRRSPSEPASSSRGFINPLFVEQAKLQDDEGEVAESMSSSIRSILLKRRRTMSSTN